MVIIERIVPNAKYEFSFKTTGSLALPNIKNRYKIKRIIDAINVTAKEKEETVIIASMNLSFIEQWFFLLIFSYPFKKFF